MILPPKWHAVVGLEREFYADALPTLDHPLLAHCSPETTPGQYEYALKHTADIAALIEADAQLQSICKQHYAADFLAKPFLDKAGSGLHIHVHLEDEAGVNLFSATSGEPNALLRYALGGLLAALPEDMAVFAPHLASRARFQHPDFMTPTTLSWGFNNRTAALRLPDAGTASKRIEHRVAGADADAQAVIDAILRAIEDGITREIAAPPAVWGDAADAAYGLPRILEAWHG